jgi:hypothetical protein
MKLTYFLLHQITLAGFSTIGCFSTALQPSPLQPLTAENCANKCLEEQGLMSFTTPIGCGCTNTTEGFFRQNDAECGERCSDGSPCGGRDRVSVYELTKPISPTIAVMTPTPVATSSPSNPNPGSVDASIGAGDSLNQRQIAIYASLGAALIIGVVGVTLFIRRKRRLDAVPTLPRHGNRNKDYLIPNVPKTTNLVYSVHREYTGKEGEMSVRVDDVVCLQQYKGEWGMGINVTSGEKGRIPLVCFVDLKFEATMPKK